MLPKKIHKRKARKGKGGGKLRPSTQGGDRWSGGVGQVLPELPPDRPHVKAEKSYMKSYSNVNGVMQLESTGDFLEILEKGWI